MASARPVVLLGPQRFDPILREAVEALGVGGRMATITAGWEEREGEDAELVEHLGGKARNLWLYHRVEEIYQRDPELCSAVRGRHERLRKLQDLYRLRLAHALAAARELLAKDGDPELLEPEREDAVAAVRRLDAQHLERIRQVHLEFEERWKPLEREQVQRQRRQMAREIAGCAAVGIAGGHVAILLNRLRLLDLPALFTGLPIFAWSAGAMVLGPRVILFHDNPPQGPGNAEVFEAGLDVYSGVVPLPHARQRLRLDDPQRVALFARRFDPDLGVALEKGSRIDWDGERWRGAAGTMRLQAAGALTEVVSA